MRICLWISPLIHGRWLLLRFTRLSRRKFHLFIFYLLFSFSFFLSSFYVDKIVSNMNDWFVFNILFMSVCPVHIEKENKTCAYRTTSTRELTDNLKIALICWNKHSQFFFSVDRPYLCRYQHYARSNTGAKTQCKRTQHCWPTTPNIVRCYMLRPFAHLVACC